MDFDTIDNSKIYCIYKVYHEGCWIITHSKKTADHVYDVLCDHKKRMYPKQWDKNGEDYFNLRFWKYYCHRLDDTFLSLDCKERFILEDLEKFAKYADLDRDEILKRFGIVPKEPCNWFGFFKKPETTTKEFLLG